MSGRKKLLLRTDTELGVIRDRRVRRDGSKHNDFLVHRSAYTFLCTYNSDDDDICNFPLVLTSM